MYTMYTHFLTYQFKYFKIIKEKWWYKAKVWITTGHGGEGHIWWLFGKVFSVVVKEKSLNILLRKKITEVKEKLKERKERTVGARDANIG